MPAITERHRAAREGKGPLKPSETEALRTELVAIKARSAEIEAALDIVPQWRPGITVEPDERYSHQGTVYSVVQGHRTQADWPPPAVPALFRPE